VETPKEQHLAEVESCGKLATFARTSGVGASYNHESHMLTVKQGGWGPFEVSGEAIHQLVEAVGVKDAWRILREGTTPAGNRLQFCESIVQLIDEVRASKADADA